MSSSASGGTFNKARVNWGGGAFFASWLEGSTNSSQVSKSGSIHLEFSVQHMVSVQKLHLKIMQKFMALVQYYRNKSSPLLNRNILCGALLSDTASEAHKAVITFLIASESKAQCKR